MSKRAENENLIKICYIVSIAAVDILLIVSLLGYRFMGLEKLRPHYIRDVSVDMMALIVCGVLVISIALDKPWDKQNRTLFRLIVTLSFLFHFDIASSFMEGVAAAGSGVVLVNTLLYFNETLLIYCFWSYVREELRVNSRKARMADWICKGTLLLDMVLNLLNLKFGFYFTIDAAGEYSSGPLEGAAEITSFIIYVATWFLILSEKEHSFKERLILLTFQIFPVFAILNSLASGDYSLVFPSYLLAAMLIYINVFAARSQKVLEQKVLLDKQQSALMISQIQPHFLYNVLTTISNLCVTDPEEAEETTVLFAQYLRTNLDSLRKTDTVPFSEELRHIHTYVELEKKRFGEKLNVETDIRETGFKVPALGLQPIVENSIKHGIRGKDTPGHLRLSSFKVDGGYEVVIEDDGVGFDPNQAPKEDGRSHVGMMNVRSRLEQMCHAKMTVESSPGNGCKTTIFFPEES